MRPIADAAARAECGTANIEGNMRSTAKVAPPATSEAATYLQITARNGPTRKPIGLPAYQNAGTISVQRDMLQATATPAGPQGRAMRNDKQVTITSMTPQRSQRSARRSEEHTSELQSRRDLVCR